MALSDVNWLAVGLGTVLAYGLGMIWFSPMLFGPAWSTGTHNIQPPASPPITAMLVQLVGTILLALVVGLAAAANAFTLAIAAVLAAATLIAGMDLFSQKSVPATAIDAGYILAGGGLIILAQAVV